VTDLTIRPETAGDRAAVHFVNEAAFGRVDEADLVDKLRAEGVVLVSVVAELAPAATEMDGRVVGHVLFSRMWIETVGGAVDAVALAPVAVLPEFQRRGIGEGLIRHGLELLQGLGERIVIVVGHPDYYPRFGFSCENARELESPFPREAFMATDAVSGVRGRVRYPAAFGL
jgi:putative acetyltransferase